MYWAENACPQEPDSRWHISPGEESDREQVADSKDVTMITVTREKTPRKKMWRKFLELSMSGWSA